MRRIIGGAALVALAACEPQIPDSARGVGFDRYDSYQQQREEVLTGQAQPTTLAGPPEVTGGPLDAGQQGDPAAAAANSGVPPVQASPANPAPQIVENAVGISNENNFDAVSDRRSIEGDASLIARNRARYQVIEPTALPTRPGSSVPNIVEYALQTTNPKGTPLYRRTGFFAESRYQRNCAKYPSADLAQEAFLAEGGPQRDRMGLDPDGDGFACAWDPAPFRAVRGN